MKTKNETVYILGHSPAEIQRLVAQAQILRPITERLLLDTGICPGMRVLDIGCGAGDVAMLAAGQVGPSGSVVGIDRNPEVLAIARERTEAAGLRNISLEEASVEDFVDNRLFDLVIGRYILMYQSDPAIMLRAAARLVKPGGAVAFHELGFRQECRSVPNIPLFELIDKLIRMAFSGALRNYDVGDRLIHHFWRSPRGRFAEPTPSSPCDAAISMVASRPIGRGVGQHDFHFHVVHPYKIPGMVPPGPFSRESSPYLIIERSDRPAGENFRAGRISRV